MKTIPLNIQLFIREYESLIDANDFNTLYDIAYSYFKDDSDIGFFTNIIRSIGIEPIDFFTTRIPMAFAYSADYDNVIIPAHILKISALSFTGSSLSDLKFEEGSKLKQIQSYAFKSTRLRKVTLPDSIEALGVECFAECPYLSEVYIPDSCTDIAMSTFLNSPDVTIYCSEHSQAHLFAKRNGIDFEII